MASAGEVAGEIEEVDQVLEWIWYHAKRLTGISCLETRNSHPLTPGGFS
ncbi:hypothetical protein [Thalassobacillus sp. C254]|nr:hypothetical protein [Thalassobacillus sp. C254]